jgi:hypothetical protein
MVRAVWRRFAFKLNPSKLALTPNNLAAVHGSELVETEIQRLRQLSGIGSKFYAYAKASQIVYRAIMDVVPEDEDLSRVVNLRPLQPPLFHLRPSSLALTMSSPAPVFATFRAMLDGAAAELDQSGLQDAIAGGFPFVHGALLLRGY